MDKSAPHPPPGFAEPGRDWRAQIAGLTPARAEVLARRARTAPLFAHAYAFHLNFRLGDMAPVDLLDFARAQGLVGVKIHVEDGEDRSLLAMNAAQRAAFGQAARDRRLELHVETSSTATPDLRAAADIARAIGATSLRFYPRRTGPLARVIDQVVADLSILPQLDPSGRLRFTLEQHEDLKSAELVHILARVANPRVSLLFDFANMINAFETPLAALAVQATWITEVHVKDALAVPDRSGWAHRACLTGAGHLPLHAIWVALLLLGQTAPQIRAFALEEEEDYFAPAFRFPGEGTNPVIPPRSASQTDPGAGNPGVRLARERQAAVAQVANVRALLDDIACAADAVTPSLR